MEKCKRILKWREFCNGLLWSTAQLQLFSAHAQSCFICTPAPPLLPLNGLDILITK